MRWASSRPDSDAGASWRARRLRLEQVEELGRLQQRGHGHADALGVGHGAAGAGVGARQGSQLIGGRRAAEGAGRELAQVGPRAGALVGCTGGDHVGDLHPDGLRRLQDRARLRLAHRIRGAERAVRVRRRRSREQARRGHAGPEQLADDLGKLRVVEPLQRYSYGARARRGAQGGDHRGLGPRRVGPVGWIRGRSTLQGPTTALKGGRSRRGTRRPAAPPPPGMRRRAGP